MFITWKYVKIRFKNRGSPCYFLSSRGQKIKNITKIEWRWLFLFTFLVLFCMAFLVQNLICTINIWLTLCLAHFFEQDHLINIFISGVYAKRWPKCARVSVQNLMCPKILWMSFFLTLTVRGPFHRRWKKWLISGLISEKNWVNFWKKRKFRTQN